MGKRGIGNTAIVIIVAIVIIGGLFGGYLIISSEDNGKGGTDIIDVGNISSLKFDSTVGQENISLTMGIANLNNKQDLKVRYKVDSEQQLDFSKIVLNRERREAWIYGQFKSSENLEPGWVKAPDRSYSDFENGLMEMRKNILENIPENWTGGDFTITSGGQDILIENIEVNPDFDQGIFVIEDYQEPPKQ